MPRGFKAAFTSTPATKTCRRGPRLRKKPLEGFASGELYSGSAQVGGRRCCFGPLEGHLAAGEVPLVRFGGQLDFVAVDGPLMRDRHAIEGDLEGNLVAIHRAIADGDWIALRAQNRAGELVAILLEGECDLEAAAAIGATELAGSGAGNIGGRQRGASGEGHYQSGTSTEQFLHRLVPPVKFTAQR